MPEKCLTLDVLERIVAETDERKLAEVSLSALSEIIPASYYCAIYFDPKVPVIDVFHPGEGWLRKENSLVQTMLRVGPGNPVTRGFFSSQQSQVSVRSEIMPDRLYQRTEVYNELDRLHGVKDVSVIFQATRSGHAIGMVCGRNKRFDLEDVEPMRKFQRVLNSLAPFRASMPREIQVVPPSVKERYSVQSLSDREREVLHWICEGKRNSEIALILGISVHTVRHHLEKIYPKIGVETRAGAMLHGRNSAGNRSSPISE